MTWPLELSHIVLDYAGDIQTIAQIERDEAIEYVARQNMNTVIVHMSRLGKKWKKYVSSAEYSHQEVVNGMFDENMRQEYDKISPAVVTDTYNDTYHHIEWIEVRKMLKPKKEK